MYAGGVLALWIQVWNAQCTRACSLRVQVKRTVCASGARALHTLDESRVLQPPPPPRACCAYPGGQITNYCAVLLLLEPSQARRREMAQHFSPPDPAELALSIGCHGTACNVLCGGVQARVGEALCLLGDPANVSRPPPPGTNERTNAPPAHVGLPLRAKAL